MFDWLLMYQDIFIWLSIASLLLLGLGIISTPYLVGLIPQDYFLESYQFKSNGWTIKIISNLLGWILLLAGLVMLVLPGQGILTILFAIFLIDFPKKRKLEQKVVANDKVFATLNWLRVRYQHPKLKR